ncbi:MAG: phosphopantetheine-binding protein [Winogradskyella sp.]|uniref:phosphopantetheine-binding protein n=1 Tax=Winogradskyella sp. TaxID=1883156 RepID=UPI00385F4779
MGLDSIALLMSVEDTFGIRIDDSEAKKVFTVKDFMDAIYRKIILNPIDKCLTQIVFYRIRKAFKKLNLTDLEIEPNSKISDLLTPSALKLNWQRLEVELGLKLPELVAIDFNPNLDAYVNFFGIRTIKRNLAVTKGTIRSLIDWILSLNFEKIIDIQNISNTYEIERIVLGIVSKIIGIPISEIQLKHTFINDLGIN